MIENTFIKYLRIYFGFNLEPMPPSQKAALLRTIEIYALKIIKKKLKKTKTSRLGDTDIFRLI